jgi:hypothetical protein
MKKKIFTLVPTSHYTQFDEFFNNLLIERVEAEEIPNKEEELLLKFKEITKVFTNIDFGLRLGTLEIHITNF